MFLIIKQIKFILNFPGIQMIIWIFESVIF